MPGISVIMPMYNASKTVTYSIDALLNQTCKDIEILVVDDCSTDASLALCKEKYKDEPRVVLLKQDKNGGPAVARNRAIEEAKGEYITFLDSDDGIVREGLERMYETAKEYDADVVHTTGCYLPVHKSDVADIMSVPQDHYIPQDKDRNPVSETTLLSEDFAERLNGLIRGEYNGNVWGKMFRRSFLIKNNIRFASLKMSEDVLFSFECLMRAKRYVLLPYRCILYRIVGESLSRGNRDIPFMLKILEATFSGDDAFMEKMNNIPFFAEHPEHKDAVMKYLDDTMDMVYLTPGYQEVGGEKLKGDARVHELFQKHFGSHAAMFERFFYAKMDKEPPVPDYLIGEITYETLLAQLKGQGN